MIKFSPFLLGVFLSFSLQNREIHLPMSIRRISQKVILIRKSDRLPPQIIWDTPPAAVSEGVLRFARPGPCQMNTDSPKWDLKVPRTQEILHFAFFVFLDSGGECVYFPRKENNSPRAKCDFGVKIGLERLGCCNKKPLTPQRPQAIF